MSDPTRYRVPASTFRLEEEIKHSRFITTLARAGTIEDATTFIRQVSEEFSDATHNCWAYLVGPPGSSDRVGMSDAGEPHGTAGRPMLSALQHSGLGDVVAVVTRYYGGTKLGGGGLVRAYGGGVQRALAALPLVERVEWVSVMVVTDYPRMGLLQQLFPDFEAQMQNRICEADVRFELKVPRGRLSEFRAAALDATRGRATVTEVLP
jgi:uncharacterized YigZ family protein